MVNVYILKSNEEYESGQIVSMERDKVESLIDKGIARYAKGSDFLVKQNLGNTEVSTRAFKQSPKTK